MPFQPMSAYGAGPDEVRSQGDQLPVRQQTMVQANAGLGFGSPSAYPPVPYGQMGAMGSDPSGIGAYAVRSGSLGVGRALGSLFTGSPLIRAAQIVKNRGLSGLGDDAAAPVTAAPAAGASALLVAAVAVGLVVTGASGYYVGKAVAPNSSKESKYAWWGVVAALLGGPLGLGIEAAVALEHK